MGEGEIWHNIGRWKMLQVLLPKLTTIFFWCVTQSVETSEACALYLAGRSDVPCTDTMTTNKGRHNSLGEGKRKNEESCVKRKCSKLL